MGSGGMPTVKNEVFIGLLQENVYLVGRRSPGKENPGIPL